MRVATTGFSPFHAAVEEDVYVVGKPFNGKLSLLVATELKPEVSGMRKFLSNLGGKKVVLAPPVEFEIPCQRGCFCATLESKYDYICNLYAA